MLAREDRFLQVQLQNVHALVCLALVVYLQDYVRAFAVLLSYFQAPHPHESALLDGRDHALLEPYVQRGFHLFQWVDITKADQQEQTVYGQEYRLQSGLFLVQI